MRLRGVLASVAVGSALLVGGLAAPAQAAPAAAQDGSGSRATAAGWYLYDYYYWLSDCNADGRMGYENGWWSRWDCRNGSWVPGDDYELWVYA